MSTPTFAAVILALAPALAFAVDPHNLTNTPLPQNADAYQSAPSSSRHVSLSELNASFAKTKSCYELESALRADHAAKRAAYTTEFKGKVPLAFTDVLTSKAERIDRQHKICYRQYAELGGLFAAIQQGMRGEDASKPEFKKKRLQIHLLKEQFHRMQPTTKQYNRTAPKQPETN